MRLSQSSCLGSSLVASALVCLRSLSAPSSSSSTRALVLHSPPAGVLRLQRSARSSTTYQRSLSTGCWVSRLYLPTCFWILCCGCTCLGQGHQWPLVLLRDAGYLGLSLVGVDGSLLGSGGVLGILVESIVRGLLVAGLLGHGGIVINLLVGQPSGLWHPNRGHPGATGQVGTCVELILGLALLNWQGSSGWIVLCGRRLKTALGERLWGIVFPESLLRVPGCAVSKRHQCHRIYLLMPFREGLVSEGCGLPLCAALPSTAAILLSAAVPSFDAVCSSATVPPLAASECVPSLAASVVLASVAAFLAAHSSLKLLRWLQLRPRCFQLGLIFTGAAFS